MLGAAHGELAERFAGRGGFKGAERFADGDWVSLVTGAPVLADALAAIDCRVEDIVERHTHAIVIGAVQAVRIERRDIRAAALAQPVRVAGMNVARRRPASRERRPSRAGCARWRPTARATRDPARILPRAVDEWAQPLWRRARADRRNARAAAIASSRRA